MEKKEAHTTRKTITFPKQVYKPAIKIANKDYGGNFSAYVVDSVRQKNARAGKKWSAHTADVN